MLTLPSISSRPVVISILLALNTPRVTCDCISIWRRGEMIRLVEGMLWFNVFVWTWTGCRPGSVARLVVDRRCVFA